MPHDGGFVRLESGVGKALADYATLAGVLLAVSGCDCVGNKVDSNKVTLSLDDILAMSVNVCFTGVC